jgi:Proteasome activator PA28, C-terminal
VAFGFSSNFSRKSTKKKKVGKMSSSSSSKSALNEGSVKALDKVRERLKMRALHMINSAMPEKIEVLGKLCASSLCERPVDSQLDELFGMRIERAHSLLPQSNDSTSLISTSNVVKIDAVDDDDCENENGNESSSSSSSSLSKKRGRESVGDDVKLVEGGGKRQRSMFADVCVPTNPLLVKLLAIMRNQLIDVIDITNSIRVWVQLSIPQIETGANFGVQVQEDVVNEVSKVEEAAYGLCDALSRYHASRAKLVSKALKYPSVHDYRATVRELDSKQHLGARLSLLDLHNNLLILSDVIHKNMDKILSPRGESSHVLLY